ncbi:AcrR family transcriptional regulator [Kitasatospora sp. GP82]|nr:AcrR family transcriptional regulator [Kitasatospora sp. GP82]
MFDEAGYVGARITTILARAGTTQGAMYFHFRSKEDLARAVMLEQASDLRLPRTPRGLQQLVDITLSIAVGLQHDALLRAGVQLAVDQGGPVGPDDSVYAWWSERFREELVVARDKGETRADMDIEEFAELLVGAYTGTQILSNIRSGRADLPERIMTLWKYLLPGVATPETLSAITLAVERKPQRV